MATIDLRECLNAISDVVNNRPHPLRKYDQIFMKSADMLLQTELVGRWFSGKKVIFIGDGDAIGLCLIHLNNKGLLKDGPNSVHILDFDERIVYSIKKFSKRYNIEDKVSSELYNVFDPLPKNHWQKYQGFYINPPFGKNNCGKSIEAFLIRGIEAVGKNALGCIVIADHHAYIWTKTVLQATQKFVINNGFIISELLPEFHHYHLEDSPDLTSCSMIISRVDYKKEPYSSKPLELNMLSNFYGKNSPLKVKYIRDVTKGGKFISSDYEVEQLIN